MIEKNSISLCSIYLTLTKVCVILYSLTLSIGYLSADEIRVAVPQLPVFKGVPYGRPFGGNPEAFTIPAIFEGLTYIDAGGQVKPLLATSWIQLSGNQWRFKLREGVRFSNGQYFNSETVRSNLSFVFEERSAAYSVVQQLAHISHIEILDSHTIDIFSSRPNPFMPQLMSIFYIVEPEQWKELGSSGFAHEPVGTGPFRVTNWLETVINLEKSELSWRSAETGRLKIMSIPNPTSRLQGILAGDLEIAFSMGPDDRSIIESRGHKMVVRATPGVITMPFNLTRTSPLQDIRVRRALNHAVDNTTIIKAILGPDAVAPIQFTSHMAYGFDPSYAPYPYDVERARTLMAEAGFSDGFDLPVEIAQGLSSYSSSIYQLVATYLARINVNMEIRPVPISRYMEVLMGGEWKETLAINLDYAVDPTLDALVPIERHSCSGAIVWYCDQDMTQLLAEAQNSGDLVGRMDLTRRVVRQQTEQAPGLLLWEKLRFDANASQVHGFIHDLNFVHYDKLVRRR